MPLSMIPLPPYLIALGLLVAGIIIMVRRMDVRWRAAHFCACSAVWLWAICIDLWRFFEVKELSRHSGNLLGIAREMSECLIMASTFTMAFAFSLVVSGVVILTAVKPSQNRP